MREYFEHNDCGVKVTEHEQILDGHRTRTFDWTATHYGKEFAFGSASDLGTTYEAAIAACEGHQPDPYRFPINFIGWAEGEKGDVVTGDGEIIGTWDTDAEYHPSFYPIGAKEPLFFNPFLGLLVQEVNEWHLAKNDT